MISNYNKAIIKELNPKLLIELESIEKEGIKNVEILEAKNGEKTLAYHLENKKIYLHSRYNPSHEAEKMVDSCKDISNEVSLIIYGVGLGYHIKEVIKRFPKMKFYLVEPNLEILYMFLCHVELKDLNLKNFSGITNDLKELDSKIPEFHIKFSKELNLIWLKNYAEHFKEEFNNFRHSYILSFKNEKQRSFFMVGYQKRTVTNQMDNLSHILKSKPLIGGDMSMWKGKYAVIVAAGPSLDDEIENLRKIKEEGLAYVFAVGSAINSLLSHGIYADAVFSYDPSQENQRVLQKIKNLEIKEIPLFYGGGIGPESLIDYPGQMYYIKNAKNSVLNYYLKEKETIPYSKLGPTITILAIDAALNMGFGHIILVGQNLGITKEKTYSSGIEYMESNNNEVKDKQYSEEEINVHGEKMKTSPTYLMMREGIELALQAYKGDAKVWNSTKKGMRIKGTEYRPLSDLMSQMITNSVVFDWESQRKEIVYDIEHIKKSRKEMDGWKEEGQKQFKRMEDVLEDIQKMKDLGQYHQMPKLYTKLNFILKRMEENEFCKMFILEAILHEYHEIILGIEKMNQIEDKKEQAEEIYNRFYNFATIYRTTAEEIDEKYRILNDELERYCLEKEQKHEN